jgi:hypothetical protein
MARQTRADWAKRIERWKDSGLTAKEFASETGISARSLVCWQWKLGSEKRAHEKAATPPMTKDSRSEIAPISRPKRRARRRRESHPATAAAPSVTFVEVAAPRQSESLEVVLASGRHVRVPIGFDAPTFERLLIILERSA